MTDKTMGRDEAVRVLERLLWDTGDDQLANALDLAIAALKPQKEV